MLTLAFRGSFTAASWDIPSLEALVYFLISRRPFPKSRHHRYTWSWSNPDIVIPLLSLDFTAYNHPPTQLIPRNPPGRQGAHLPSPISHPTPPIPHPTSHIHIPHPSHPPPTHHARHRTEQPRPQTCDVNDNDNNNNNNNNNAGRTVPSRPIPISPHLIITPNLVQSVSGPSLAVRSSPVPSVHLVHHSSGHVGHEHETNTKRTRMGVGWANRRERGGERVRKESGREEKGREQKGRGGGWRPNAARGKMGE